MPSSDAAFRDEPGRRPHSGVWAAPVAVLVAIWLWLAFSSGGYLPRQWLLPALTLGLFGLVVAILAAYPRRPRRLSLAVAALFGAYSLWVAASGLWAHSLIRVWLESGKTFAYLLVIGLALAYFTVPAARRAFRYLLMGAAFVIVAVCVWRLWSTGDIAALFVANRLNYPVSYPNNAAALLLVSFWPLLWLAAGSHENPGVRGAALGLATGLLAFGLMTQSRGAMWSLGITLVLMFVISPGRLRLVLYLLVPALLMVYAFPRLNRYWVEGPAAVGGDVGAQTIVAITIAAAVIGVVFALLERRVRVRGRTKALIGAVVFVLCVGAIVYGTMTVTKSSGGPVGWVSSTWKQFTTDATSRPGSDPAFSRSFRFAQMSSAGRVDIWRAAWQEFEAVPWLGQGGDNFVIEYNRLRTDPISSSKIRQAHSITLQVLGDTGIVGGILVFGGVLLAAGGILWPRCAAGWRGARKSWLRRRRRAPDVAPSPPQETGRPSRWGDDPTIYGWEMALFAGVAYWFIHANVEWLWQMAGVSIPAVLMLAAAVAGADARAGTMWPRLARRPREQVSEAPGAEEASAPERADVSASPMTRRQIQAELRQAQAAKKKPGESGLLPPGPLSRAYQAALAIVAVVVLVLAGLSYASQQVQTSALAASRTDPAKAAARAAWAAPLVPGDPAPWVTQGSIYTNAAREALLSAGDDKAGAVLDNLSLAIGAHQRAVDRDPADWVNHYRLASALVDLWLAKTYAEGRGADVPGADIATYLGSRHDWSGLTGVQNVPPVGATADSLARDADSRAIAARYRDLTPDQLRALALHLATAAERMDPLDQTIDELVTVINSLPDS